MAEKPLGESDYQKMGAGEKNLYALYFALNMGLAMPGIVGAFVAFKTSEATVAKVSSISAIGVGPMYLAWTFLRYCLYTINANLGTSRRPTGVNVPDQHVYKVKGGPADGSVVLMDDSSPLFGPFNRAQRALQNFGEAMPMVVGDFFLAGYVFPVTASLLLSAFGVFRVKGAMDYAVDRTKRMKGQMASMLCIGTMSGLTLAVGVRSTFF